MKIHFINDIHLETGDYTSLNNIDCDIIVASGDIGEGVMGVNMLKKVNKPCIYVLGNHEFWSSDGILINFKETIENIRLLAKNSNVHFLENDEVIIDGVRFLGTTLWTDFGKLSPKLIGSALRYMKDYSRIGASSWFANIENVVKFKIQMVDLGFDESYINKYIESGRFHPLIAFDLHEKAVDFLDEKLSEQFNGETIVVSHHAPTFVALKEFGINERYFKEDAWENSYDDPNLIRVGCYASDLDWLLKKHKGKVSLWGFGHLHKVMDFIHEGIRFISNPRGYYEGPLTLDQAESYLSYGVNITKEEVKKSKEKFLKDPFLGTVQNHRVGWVVDTVGAIEEGLLELARTAIKKSSLSIEKLEEIIPFLESDNKVIADSLKESALNRYNEARDVLRDGAIKIINQLEVEDGWFKNCDNYHTLLINYGLIDLSKNVCFVFCEDIKDDFYEFLSPTTVANKMIEALQNSIKILLELPFHYIKIKNEVLNKLRVIGLDKNRDIYIGGWITSLWIGSIKDFIGGYVYIDGLSFDETDLILSDLQKGVHLMVGALDSKILLKKLV